MCDNKLAKAPLLWYHHALLGARRRRPLIILRPACPGAVNLKPAPEAASELLVTPRATISFISRFACLHIADSAERACDHAS
jgi:hypothetical protein